MPSRLTMRMLYRYSRSPLAIAMLFAPLAGLAPSVRGDETVELVNGFTLQARSAARVEGGEYQVLLDNGIELRLPPMSVRRVVQEGPAELYRERLRSMPDTLEAHEAIAQWCRDHRLSDQAKHHWCRVLRFTPDHEKARSHLGYQRHKGRWQTRDEIMASRGMVAYDGKYRTPQDVALREIARREEEAEARWYRDVKLWLSWAGSKRPTRAEEGVRSIASIQDPLAANAIIRLLKRTDTPRLRTLLVESLARLDHPNAVRQLVALSIQEPDLEARLQSLDHLLERGQPIALSPYVAALDDSDNETVNAAAQALQHVGNQEAISPLIDALVTRHTYSPNDAPPGQISTSFSSSSAGGGSGGFSFGGGGAKAVPVDVKNPEVRRALVELSGGIDFEYDEKAWRRWFVNEQMLDAFDARRDQ
ncbi:MAG: HEAT repeat domain-containing protein [Planctomycetota bacterium]